HGKSQNIWLEDPTLLSWKPCQGDSLNPTCMTGLLITMETVDASFQLESDSLPNAHAQNTKTDYKHRDLRFMKAQE
ncbi:hypothetical protein Tco_0435896, partial [Tanacetum coccineum]